MNMHTHRYTNTLGTTWAPIRAAGRQLRAAASTLDGGTRAPCLCDICAASSTHFSEVSAASAQGPAGAVRHVRGCLYTVQTRALRVSDDVVEDAVTYRCEADLVYHVIGYH